MPRTDGVDVARYQGNIDWGRVNLGWTACKATQGRKYVDPTFVTNRAGMRAKYKIFYHFLSSDVYIPDQVDHFLRTVGTLGIGEGLMLDAERDNLTGEEPDLEDCLNFCNLVEKRTGRPISVYTGVYVSGGSLWHSSLLFNGKRPRILAAYTSEDRARKISAPHKWDVWQWTSSGRVDGIPTLVDIDQVDNWEIWDAVCGYDQDPVPSMENDVKIITNKETYRIDNVDWSPGKVKWMLMNDGTKRHMNEWEYMAYSMDLAKEVGYPTGALGMIPDWKPPVGLCSFPANKEFKLTGQVSGKVFPG